jgi:hypothetical protein
LDPLIKSQLLYQLSYAPIESIGPGHCEAGDVAKARRPVQLANEAQRNIGARF